MLRVRRLLGRLRRLPRRLRHLLGLARWRVRVRLGYVEPYDRAAAMQPIYERRYEASRDVLEGEGLEIGAGPDPQRLPGGAGCQYFDVRDEPGLAALFDDESIPYEVHLMEEIEQRFPDGADFLIAHNVLEHVSDPIRVLQEWFGYLRDGGVCVISLPEKNHCPPDALRAVPPLEHLVLDYLLDRDDDAFESREHIFSFLCGWVEHAVPDTDKLEFAEHCLREAQRSGHDLHWHALDRDRGAEVIQAAGLLGRQTIEMIRICDVDSEPIRTFGEAIYIFRVHHRPANGQAYAVTPELQTIAARLLAAGQELERAIEAAGAGGPA